MKTKFTSKFIMLILSVVMIATLLIGTAGVASAADTGTEPEYVSPATGEAKIYGANVNLGGDISMKYYVEIGEGIDIDKLVLETFFLGEVKALTAAEVPDTIDGHTLYVYTLTSINPQCMGDTIDAKLVYDGSDMVGDRVNKNGYSVKTNLENTYKNTSDEKLKSLILDTLKYGEAAQKYTEYKPDAFVTNGELADAIAVDPDKDPSYNQGYKYTGSTEEIYLAETEAITVKFGNVNTIKFRYVAPEGSKVTINGEEVTPIKEGDYWVVETKAIAATDFYKLYTVVIADTVTVEYSVNTYCNAVYKGEQFLTRMKILAYHLYNYGLSAHIYDDTEHVAMAGTPTCTYQALCLVCENFFGEKLPHNYTYAADEETNTITETCNNGCSHNKTITLGAPENRVYDGNAKAATVDGALDAEYEITYNADPINVGTYTATLTAGGVSVNLDFTIIMATPSVTAPTPNTLTYTGAAQPLVSAGATNFGTMVYSLTNGEGSFVEDIPKSTDAGTYTVYYYVKGDDNVNDTAVESVTVKIEKADATVTAAPTGKTGLTYTGVAQDLIDGGTASGGTMVYSLSENGEYSANIPTGTGASNYTVWYYVQGDANHKDSAKASLTVNIAKATLTVTAKDHTITYGDAAANNGVTYTGFVNGENENVLGGELTYSYTYTQYDNVGEYTISITGLTSDNYDITFVGAALTVTKKNVSDATIELGVYNSVYDGKEKTPAILLVTVDDVDLREGMDFTVSYKDNVYVGDAKVIIEFNGNYAGTIEKTFEITQDPKTTAFEGAGVTIPKTDTNG